MKDCAECGKPTFWNNNVWTSKDGLTRHTDCDKAQRQLAAMPELFGEVVQQVVELQERLGVFASCNDDEWADVEFLRRVIMNGYHLADTKRISDALAAVAVVRGDTDE